MPADIERACKKEGNYSMQVTVRFGNPLIVTVYTVALLTIG